jgi:hypothetical protein
VTDLRGGVNRRDRFGQTPSENVLLFVSVLVAVPAMFGINSSVVNILDAGMVVLLFWL